MLLGLLLIVAIGLMSINAKPLDDYVWRPDENYKWEDMGESYRMGGEGLGFTGYTLKMTSQRWLTDADFSNSSDAKSIWWHYVVVIVPDEIKYTRNASLWITGGGMGGPPSADSEDIMVCIALALTTNTVVGALFQIPNEHMTFSSDPLQKSRTEDAIIAFTWDHYINDPSNPEWLVRFPMVKASLRAMDTMTDFMAKQLPERNCQLDYYGVSGASKRGWTTWLVGAVDPKRVMLIIPIVLDAINFQVVEHHQFRSYNGWSWALSDYADMNIMARMDDPNMQKLSEQEDPFYFIERLTMPKLIINAVLDEFQQPDDTHYWWSSMPEPKHFIMTPNAEHSEATGILEIVPAISAWLQYHLREAAVPTFTWTINEGTGEIVATLDNHGVVHEAKVWWAYSCGAENESGILRRDFRIANLDSPCGCGFAYDGYCANLKSWWRQEVLTASTVNGRRTYSAKLDAPGDGRWVAFFIDISYDRPKLEADEKLGFFPKDLTGRLEFTTEVSVWPNTFPFADCSGLACGNKLV